jgi:hypothetical protein
MIVSKDGVSTEKGKINAVMSWERPRTVKEVQSFLGFCNFYHRFIPEYSKIARPLTQLTKKDLKFEWKSETERAFQMLKEKMCQAPVLIHANPTKPFVLETDCSDFALAGVLSQAIYDDATKRHALKPVGYYSRTLNDAERNYEIYDKELLAIVECLKHWHVYLHSNKLPIQIWSNHQNLEYFMTTKQLTRREARWALIISEYNFVINYRTGESNGKADALSRKPGDKPLKGDDRTTGSVLKPQHFAHLAAVS